MTPYLGATDALSCYTADVRKTEKNAQLSCTVRFSIRFSKVPWMIRST